MSKGVSVCIPIYNGEEYLKESLESVVNQTFTDLEIIVVDDCSTDQSVEVVREFQLRDPRIKLVLNETNLGLVGNWNKCIELASRDWIKFQFQDDTMELDTIEKMYDLAKEAKVRLVLTDRRYVSDFNGQKVLKKYHKISRLSQFVQETRVVTPLEICEITNHKFFGHNFLGEPILGLWSKELVNEYGVFDIELKQLVDFEFWFRISSNEFIGFINEELHTFRVHGNSQTARNNQIKGINPAMIDKVDIINKVRLRPIYANFRNLTQNFTDKEIDDYFDFELVRMVVQIGYLRYKKNFGSHRLPRGMKGRPTRVYRALRTDFKKTMGLLPE